MTYAYHASGAQIIGEYRYTLWRVWAPSKEKRVVWIMLNPSTADGTTDDPTIRRCIGFSKAWGYNRLTVVNLFALRSPDPMTVKAKIGSAIGPLNDSYLLKLANDIESTVVAAWGAQAFARDRAQQVLEQIDRPIYCLGRTKDGSPKHPLYVPASAALQPFPKPPFVDRRPHADHRPSERLDRRQ